MGISHDQSPARDLASIQERGIHLDLNRWQAIFGSIPVGLALADLDGMYLEANPRFLELLGYSLQEIQFFHIADLTHPSNQAEIRQGLENLLRGKTAQFSLQKRIIRSDSECLWIRDTLSLVKDELGRPTQIISVTQDISEKYKTEQALRSSEERLRAMVTYTSIGITLIGLTGDFIDVNPAFAHMLQRSPAELLSLSIKDITYPEDFGRTQEQLQKLLAGDLPFFRIVKRYVRKDGSWIWAQSTVSLTRDEQQRPVHIVAVTEDITQRIQAEEKLIRSQEQLELAVSVSKVGFFNWNIADNRTELSQQLRNDLGISRQQEIFTTEECLSYIHPEDRARFRNEIKTFIETDHFNPAECRAIREDKRLIWLELKGRLTRDLDGRPTRFFGTSLDITERKRIEEVLKIGAQKLRLAEERMRLATEAAQMGIWDYNPLNKVLQMSPRARDILGFSSEDKVDVAAVAALVHDEERIKAEAELRSALDPLGAGHYEVTLRIVQAKGEVRWVLVFGQTYFEEQGTASSQAVRIIGALLDVTDQSEMQKEIIAAKDAAEAANATKSVFLANMSHEIRTPLSAILGFSQLLLDGKSSDEQRHQYLKTIIRNGRSLLYIIDDILDLSKVEAGRLELEWVACSVRELIEEVTDLFREKVSAKSISLSVEIEHDVPDIITSDPTRLKQILINLIGNAVKFTEKGGVFVQVQSLEDTAQPQLRIAIRDTGIGMSGEQQAKLFQPFSQADSSTTRKFGGTGLGLHLAKRLAMALGGDISVEHCVPAKGCTFVLSLIAHRLRGSPAPLEGREQPHEATESLDGSKILLAEDALDNQLLIQTILNAHGGEVTIANNGIEAVGLALASDFDLILMDLQMPQMDGYEATRTLRLRGFTKPIIALTAHGMLEERQRTAEAGCNDHLTKPLDPRELIDTIRSYAKK